MPPVSRITGSAGTAASTTIDTEPVGAVPRIGLQLTAEEMREAGYRTVDMLVRHLTDEEAPPIRRATVPEMRTLLGQAAPEHPTPFAEVLEGLERDVLPYRARGDHPGFFAFISYCGTWPGALGDFVASAANVYASSWLESAGPSQVELAGARVVQGVDRVSGVRLRNSGQRRLCREYDRPRVRERGACGADERRSRGIRPRSGALIGCPGCPGARLPPRSGARAPGRRGIQARSRRRCGGRSRPTAWQDAARSSFRSAVAARIPARSIR